jgi:hypothetical protein
MYTEKGRKENTDGTLYNRGKRMYVSQKQFQDQVYMLVEACSKHQLFDVKACTRVATTINRKYVTLQHSQVTHNAAWAQ